jgi:Ni/Fe-hydrogenase subunit HybB-like protein
MNPADDLTRPILRTGRTWWLAVLAMAGITAFAGYAWTRQLAGGLHVTGLGRPVFWGLYITNYVFWIGISHAGTLISAILRLTHSGWRRPITRCAEAITLFALVIGPSFAIVHLGRPWLFYTLLPLPNERGLWPNFRSPLVWDLVAITTYLIGSLLYLYLPMIPDMALLRDRVGGWRRPIYRLLAAGWRGTESQWRRLEKAINVMAIAILLVAVSVHTVVSYVFAMSVVPTWHSTIFGPYFVVGAIFSGLAMLLIAMAVLRRTLKLQAYLRPEQFDNLGKLLLVMALLWGYFVVCEHLGTWYGNNPAENAIMDARSHGAAAPWFWAMVTCNLLLPVPLLSLRRVRRSPWALAGVGVLVSAGMYLERFLIVVSALERPRLASAWGLYTPSWVEISITVGTFSLFTLLYLLFVKLFPIVAIWEVRMEDPT